jgi:hypothetical protein
MRWVMIAASGLALCMCTGSAVALDYFTFTLFPEQVVPPAQGVQGYGAANFMLNCPANGLQGGMRIELGETVTGVHIHGPADLGQNGDVIFELPLPTSGLIDAQLSGVAPYCEILNRQLCYVDVHTSAHPEGAIRGQILHEVAVKATPWSVAKRLYR